MSFLAGFVEALGDDAADRRKRSRDLEDKKVQREDDKLFYDFQLSKQYEWDRKKQEDDDKKLNKKASNIATNFGYDPESKAGQHIKSMVISGMTDEHIHKFLKENRLRDSVPADVEGLPGSVTPKEVNEAGTGVSDNKISIMTPEEVTEAKSVQATRNGVEDSLGVERGDLVKKGVVEPTNLNGLIIEPMTPTGPNEYINGVNDSNAEGKLLTAQEAASRGDPDAIEAISKLKSYIDTIQKNIDMSNMRVGFATWTDPKTQEVKSIQVMYNGSRVVLTNNLDPNNPNPDGSETISISQLSPTAQITEHKNDISQERLDKNYELLKPFRETKAAGFELLTTMKQMDVIYKGAKYAGTGVAEAVNKAKSILFNVEALFELIGEQIDGDSVSREQYFAAVNKLADINGIPIDNYTKQILMLEINAAFQYAATNGQTGKDVTNADFQRFLNAVTPSRPEKMHDQIYQMTKMMERQMQKQYDSLKSPYLEPGKAGVPVDFTPGFNLEQEMKKRSLDMYLNEVNSQPENVNPSSTLGPGVEGEVKGENLVGEGPPPGYTSSGPGNNGTATWYRIEGDPNTYWVRKPQTTE